MVKQMHNGQVLVGYIAANEAIEEYLLKDFLSKKIAPYMIPQKFVFMDALPLTPTGKVDRKLLPTPAFSAEDIVAPRNEAAYEIFHYGSSVTTGIWGMINSVASYGINKVNFT